MSTTEQISLKQKVLIENQRIAQSLHARYDSAHLLCLNLISSPGSGKTALLEKTLEVLGQASPRLRVAVLTGDIQTDNDARRLARYGYPVKQITTGGTCHLDGTMIERALADWNLNEIDILFIENVGNLVCPSSYDLGEHSKIVLLSVTEGEDKPLKYPSIFFKSSLLLMTKVDLLGLVPFDADEAERNARRIHPEMEIIRSSATREGGIDAWLAWLQGRLAAVREGVYAGASHG
jgi:hydrogenase nickel incorporation protein HypB